MVSPFAHQQYVANVLLQPQMFNQQAWNLTWTGVILPALSITQIKLATVKVFNEQLTSQGIRTYIHRYNISILVMGER